MKKALIIDGNSLLYRAFFALPLLQTAKGEYTNAVYGFTTMLLKILEEEKPDYVAVALDKGKKTFRHETYQEYKGHRPKMPVELSGQFKLLREMLELMNIKHLELENYEADDIIGTFAKKSQGEGLKTVIVSGDKDVLQLVDSSIEVILTKKGISQTVRYSPQTIFSDYGLTPSKLIDVKALMGDSSDNIPGVRGVGEKTAIKLIKTFESLEGVYDNLKIAGGPKLRENLREDKENAIMSKALVTINKDVPINLDYNQLKFNEFSQELIAFFRRLEFTSLLDRIRVAHGDFKDLKTEEVKFTKEKLNSKQYGIILEDKYLYIGTEKQYFCITEYEDIKEILEDKGIEKICFDYKGLLKKARDLNIKVTGVIFDIFLGAYLLQADKSNYSVEDLAQNILEITIDQNNLGQKCCSIFQIYKPLRDRLEEMGSLTLLHKVEMPLSEILFEMEREGIFIDKEYLEQLSFEFGEELKSLEAQIWAYSKEKFNINSPKQLGVVLFDELNLPVLKKTKTGYSTDVSVLEQLQGEHPIIDHILRYRTIAKLKSTYADGLKALVKEDGKIHTTFNQTITATGRLSSTEPNLQNIPIKAEEGKKIRKAFIAPKGYALLSLDYSQIELRILAHMSGDENLLDGFRKGQDIHTRTASEVFLVGLDEVTEQHRRHAKAVNFGIVYGMSDFGLSQSLAISRKEARDYIDRYFDRYQGVKKFIDSTILSCKEKGYVDTLFNRRRFIHEINSSNFNRRSFAERTAVNTPIQGTAADIIKKAMVDFHKSNCSAKLLLQVHDELVFLVEEEKVEEVTLEIKDLMENTVRLDVPLIVESKKGSNWKEMK